MAILTGLEWVPTWLLIIAMVWSLIWKGLALWRSARNGQRVWYVVLLLVNTIGILEILYLLLWQKNMEKRAARKARRKRKR